MWFVVKQERIIPSVESPYIEAVGQFKIDRLVDSLDEVEHGEYFIKCDVKD